MLQVDVSSPLPTQQAADELLSLTQAAQHVGVSKATIRRWITLGHLLMVRVGRRHYVRQDDLATAQASGQGRLEDHRWRRNPQRAGLRLRLLREQAGFHQQERAAASGLTHEEISWLEHGQRTPLRGTVRALAEALGVVPEVFVARTKLDPVGLSTDEVAARLEVLRGRVQKWLHAGKLPGVKVSGQWRVPMEAVLELERRERLRGRSRRLDPRYRG
jgi:excisionase family DNA binding protein